MTIFRAFKIINPKSNEVAFIAMAEEEYVQPRPDIKSVAYDVCQQRGMFKSKNPGKFTQIKLKPLNEKEDIPNSDEVLDCVPFTDEEELEFWRHFNSFLR